MALAAYLLVRDPDEVVLDAIVVELESGDERRLCLAVRLARRGAGRACALRRRGLGLALAVPP